MKRILLLLLCGSFIQVSAQVGIGTSHPLAGFHVADSNVLFSAAGDVVSGTSTPISGEGRRMMWFADKAAFRAGYVGAFGATYWNANNIGNYSFATGYNTRASGAHSIAMGIGSVASGVSAVALGENNTASGANSVALGYHASTNVRQGTFVFADRSTVDTLRAGVNHSANFRVSGGFRIFTSSNLSTGVTIQSGTSVSNWGQANAVISTSTGAYLTTGGVWQNASDENLKFAFSEVDDEEVLGRLRSLPVSTWSYLVEGGEVRHMGPTAQDFQRAFGLGTSDRSIGTVDADGVALAAAKALERRTAEQAEELRGQAVRIEALRAENDALKAQAEAMNERMAVLERLIAEAAGGQQARPNDN
ncbi:tail fiber domain-containing protein [Parapedobacter sp. ISTM3]|uniref:tail fiber domain-containing protein n=1 Tax=Parapedobacter sp. ISTM3 TaxID=2800130 RepID=UPI001907061C|nr:tail fiber domain-containing protein [Parapedobacter sp. ISTM3]MBK1442741.1 tail fiber domain-containing protein [Parapedobacter sp. ISTM3]